jgi:hypothetical protein
MSRKVTAIMGLVALALFIGAGCQGERGLKGDPADVTCFGCHSDENLEFTAIQSQWENSKHAIGANIDRTTVPCVRCHTGQGFLASISGGDTVAVENPSVINCFTCHAPHTTGGFNLRAAEPPVMELGGDFNFGNANLCAHCHQARKPSPFFAGADSITITNRRWGPHHSMQADVFAGLHAYQDPDAGTYDSTSPHNTIQPASLEGCIACHMAAPHANDAGGHSTNMTYAGEEEVDFTNGCNITGCHGGDLDDFSYNGVQDSVEVLLEELRTLLVGADLIVDSTGLVNASTTAPLVITEEDAGAIFNFLLFEGDRSLGVHNPNYYFDALNASIVQMSTRFGPARQGKLASR